MNTVKSVALFYRDGSSDKEYNIFLNEENEKYTVSFSYGRRGNATNTGNKVTDVSLTKAEEVYNKLLKEKTAKGYVADGEGKPFSDNSLGEMTGLVPQLLNPITEDELEKYLTDENWLMQEKFDGKRIMVRVQDGKVIASNRRGLGCGIPLEIEKELLTLGNCVLDGELVGDKYYIFDILEDEKEDYKPHPYFSRLDYLEYLIQGYFYHLICATTLTSEDAKRKYFTVFSLGEGVVFKNKHASYVPGRPNSGGNQVKYKFYNTCTVGILKINDKRSVEVYVENDGILSVGNVTIPSNLNIPKIWDHAEIRYLYYYPGGSLYQPVYLGVRDDVEIDHVSSLKVKKEED